MVSISRRGFLSGLGSAGLIGRSAGAQGGVRPNVLIFLADDLGWNDVGFNSSRIRTPNIDRLAAEGVRFERAYSFPLCSPTRSGLMTGRSPMRLGVGYGVIRPGVDFGISTEERFISEAFHDAGYQTAISGKWHLGQAQKKHLPRARGFDNSYGHLTGMIDYFTHERMGGLDWNRDGKSIREEGYSTYLLGEEAVRFIRSRDRGRPFFLYMPFNAPHEPLEAPPELLAHYDDISDPMRRNFAAMVEALDATMGKVLKTLEEERIARDTIVLFFSDNGGASARGASNTPLRGSKGTTFEGGIRVPSVMRWPGRLKNGAVSRQVITMMDYFPTLAAAAGIPPGNKRPFDGANLWPSIVGGKVVARDDIFFSVGTPTLGSFAVHHGEWKLVRESVKGGEPRNYLFRIAEDPNETTDLAARNRDLVEELVRRIEQHRKLHPDDNALAPLPPGWQPPKFWAEAARD